jgi:tryptophan-rich sensory protein
MLPLLVGAGSSFFTIQAVPVYKGLVQPFFAPPSWVFGPVWTVLYILMGFAAYRVMVAKGRQKKIKLALKTYYAQLVFNFFWSLLFFSLGLRGWAFLEILVMWLLISLTIRRFHAVDEVAAGLLIPYWLWVSFASVLNASIWFLNK